MNKVVSLIVFLLLFISTSIPSFSQNGTGYISKEQVVAQMNYCINSITNVVHYKSMPLLEHEIDQLLNNLTMEQVVGLYEVQSFRETMLEKISKLQITEEEKLLINRIQAMQRENLLYKAISSSLSSTMLLTGGGNTKGQIAFMAFVTAARTAVEYKVASNEADIEELQAMWQFRKTDLEEFAKLRKDALELVYNLFQKYHLREKDRLTEATSTLFSEIIAEKDPGTRIRKLLDKESTFSGLADYYYYVGMAYVDADDYKTGKKYLDTYLSMYRKAPIFRYDEKTGCIALTKLAFEKGLSYSEMIGLIESALTNLPNNGSALIQSALILNEMGEKRKAYNLIRSGIDNHLISDKNALVMLAIRFLPEIKKYPVEYGQICAAVKGCADLSVNAYLSFLLKSDLKTFWSELPSVVSCRNDEIAINSRYSADISTWNCFYEKHKKDVFSIDSCSLSYDAIALKKIHRKFKTIKSQPELVYLFFEPVSEGSDMYKVKSGLDYQAIIDGTGLGNQFSLFTSRQRRKIVSFCKSFEKKHKGNISIIVKSAKGKKRDVVRKAYGDYLLWPENVSSIRKSDYDGDNPSLVCTVKSRGMDSHTLFPLKNQPSDILRLDIFGVDTISICFSGTKNMKDMKPYSVEYSDVIQYYEPVKTEKVVSETKLKENVFKSFLGIFRSKSDGQNECEACSSADKKKAESIEDTVVVETQRDSMVENTKNEDKEDKWIKRVLNKITFWK